MLFYSQGRVSKRSPKRLLLRLFVKGSGAVVVRQDEREDVMRHVGKRIERDSRVAYWRPGGGLWGRVRPYYLSWFLSQGSKKVVRCSDSDVRRRR